MCMWIVLRGGKGHVCMPDSLLICSPSTYSISTWQLHPQVCPEPSQSSFTSYCIPPSISQHTLPILTSISTRQLHLQLIQA